MPATGRLVSHEVLEHFATLLKQGEVPSAPDPLDVSLENVVRPAAFNRAIDSKPTTIDLDDFGPTASRLDVDAPDSSIEPTPGVTEPQDFHRPDLSSVLDKIEAAGASMRLVEERAHRQSAWTQDFMAAAKDRLKEAQTLFQDAENRCVQLEKRSETAELAVELAEQRCRTAESRLAGAEKQLAAAEKRLEAALDLARNAETRCAAATARAADAERCMQDVLNTVAREFPAVQGL